MPAPHDDEYYQQLDARLIELIRLARNPRLTERMGAGTTGDSRLFLLLNLLHDRGPSRASDLLDTLAIDQSTLSRQLAALVDRGLVQRESDPTDGRAARIVVSALGEDTIVKARAAWQDTLGSLVGAWPAADRTALLRLLSRLASELGTIVLPPETPPERVDPASTTTA